MNRWNRNGWMDTLPSFRADAGEALVVFRLLTYSTIFTGSGAAGRQQGLTVFTWWQRWENISVCIVLVIWSICFRRQHSTQIHKFKFPRFQTPEKDFIFKSDVNASLYPTSLSISMSTWPNRKGLPVSCYCAITDRKQEVGTGLGAGSSSPLILATVVCYSKTNTHTVTPARQTGRSFHTKTGISVSGHWLMFSKAT